ncbi:hypothetical protein [Streptomyces sp. JNUCC 63]
MPSGTAPPLHRPPGAKMWMRIYTVTREGTATPPRAAVIVPDGHRPVPTPMSTALPPCACPLHRTAGSAR